MAKTYKTKWEVSPEAPAHLAYIAEADDYEGSRKYKIKITLDEDDPFIKELEEHVNSVFDERRGEIDQPARGRQKEKIAEVSYPFTEEYDDKDEPTGKIIVAFTANEQFKDNKDGGKMKDIILKIYDENGELLDRENHPKGFMTGKMVKVIFSKYNFAMNATCRVGTSLRLQGLYLQEGTGGGGSKGGDTGGRAGGLGMYVNHASNCQSFLGTSGDVVKDARLAIKLHDLTSTLKEEYKDLMCLKGNEIGFIVGNVVLKACQACKSFDEVESYAHEYLAGYYDILRNFIDKGIDVDQTLEDIGFYDDPGQGDVGQEEEAQRPSDPDDEQDIPF